jgi:S-formylglutathione hydrolase FrmB
MNGRILVIMFDVTLTGVILMGCSKAGASMLTPTLMPTYTPVHTCIQTHNPTVPPLNPRISWRNGITSAALSDNLLGDPADRNYYIYLPPSYQTGDRHYPVVYVLQGYSGGVDLYNLVLRMDQLIASNDSQEMILVVIDGVNSLLGSWYLSSPTIGDYETFIAEEVVSKIDSTYRTLSTRDSRGITGCNMGGFGSLHMALMHPDVFRVAAPMSGPYDWEHWTLSLWEAVRTGLTFVPQTLWDFHNKPREA